MMFRDCLFKNGVIFYFQVMLVGKTFGDDYHASQDTLVARECHFKDFHTAKSAHLENCTARCVHGLSIEVFKGKYARVIADSNASSDQTHITDTLKGNFVQADQSTLNAIEAIYGASITNSAFKTAFVSNGTFYFSSVERKYVHEIKAKDKITVSNIEVKQLESENSILIVNGVAENLIAYNKLCGIDSAIQNATVYVTEEQPQIELYNTEIKYLTLIGETPFTPVFYGSKNFNYKIELKNSPPAIPCDLPNKS
ncbi:MAG: hypothetical protein ACK4HV_01080 [Parachlamydiaceae bacterium]